MIPLHLASRSPRRRALLEEAGISFTCVDGDVDETLSAGVDPEAAVRLLAERKARAGARSVQQGFVLGADTLVAVGERILGKPVDREDACSMLAALSGQRHRVLTGVCLLNAVTGQCRVEAGCTYVTMRVLSAQEITDYVATGESDDKAGAYAIQERGDKFVTHIEGAWDNVVGLPVQIVQQLLREASVS